MKKITELLVHLVGGAGTGADQLRTGNSAT